MERKNKSDKVNVAIQSQKNKDTAYIVQRVNLPSVIIIWPKLVNEDK